MKMNWNGENMNILLKVSYEGTNYCGYQKQPNDKTIQEELEKALSKLYQTKITSIAASRTDRGVHALSQMVTYKVEYMRIPLKNIPIALNPLLPEDIVVTEVLIVDDSFHPRYHAIEKVYEYKILNAKYQIPQLRNYTYHVKYNLDFEKMKSCCALFLGTHDFKGFSSIGGNVVTTIRTIYKMDLIKDNDIITLNISGNGFLYNMVRIIVGTIIDVGRGKKSISIIEEMLRTGERRKGGKTASPNGLTLIDIKYK